MQMVFQDPYSSLNPRMTVSDIVGEPLDIHHLYATKKRAGRARARAAGSGGPEQRACQPLSPTSSPAASASASASPGRWPSSREFIVCDEPVSALDVSIQAQVINMLEELQEKLGLTYLFIAHDLLGGAAHLRPHRA